MLRSLTLPVFLLFLLSAGARAQTITIDTAQDVLDFGGAQQIGDLPGPDGRISAVEAALASDNTPGVQTIAFQIPVSEWTQQGFYPGRAVLSPFGGLRCLDTVIFDARTQTAFTGDTNPNGAEVVITSSVYLINSVGGGAWGFDNTVITLAGGSANTVQSNSACGIELSDCSGCTIGGTNPGEGNTGGGFIKLTSSSNTIIVGNTTGRVRILGNGPFQPPSNNNRVGGPSLAERNWITGYGFLNSQGIPGGIAVEIFDADNTLIENNWIGTTTDGLSQGHPYTTIGIEIAGDSTDNTTIRNNRIAGIRATAVPIGGPSYPVGTCIQLDGMGNLLTIVGNRLGLDANNQPVLGSVTGISTANYFLGPLQHITIGGSATGTGNEIAGHVRQGILLSNSYQGVQIRGNSIHSNGQLGIDLIDSNFNQGISLNDASDLDSGANGLQNYPQIQSALRAGAQLRLQGFLQSAPNQSYSLDWFATPQCSALGFGEGQHYLGSTNLVLGPSGTGSFDVLLQQSLPLGWSISATATALSSGSTSEFSACSSLQDAPNIGSSLCLGDGSAAACPCANSGAPGRGCENSISSGGAWLQGSGSTSLANDSVVLSTSGLLPSALCIVLQGDALVSPLPFGDGLRCVGGVFKRLFVRNASAGNLQVPQASDPTISLRSAQLGDGLVAGSVRFYQVYYRDPAPNYCAAPAGGMFNISSGLSVLWTQ